MKTKEQIKKEFPSICHECELARKVTVGNEQKGYVGCALKLYKDMDVDLSSINAELLGEGWIYHKRRPFSPKNATVSSGMMANLQVITKGTESCDFFHELH